MDSVMPVRLPGRLAADPPPPAAKQRTFNPKPQTLNPKHLGKPYNPKP